METAPLSDSHPMDGKRRQMVALVALVLKSHPPYGRFAPPTRGFCCFFFCVAMDKSPFFLYMDGLISRPRAIPCRSCSSRSSGPVGQMLLPENADKVAVVPACLAHRQDRWQHARRWRWGIAASRQPARADFPAPSAGFLQCERTYTQHLAPDFGRSYRRTGELGTASSACACGSLLTKPSTAGGSPLNLFHNCGRWAGWLRRGSRLFWGG